uniref:Uncharacterized protein n=1 Tax=Setaria viridis TaxID=4556 RepID=A0A4U6VGW6_SETVI|nr:hypothetical protein SEVIR_3G274101v2 [Setaria viridis]TKW27695.1 hypothetical protein SEVIR_3G274101v2 [Setaria viridis]
MPGRGLDVGLVADPAGEPVRRGRADEGREAADRSRVRVDKARVRGGGGRPGHPGGVPAPHDRAEPRRRGGGDGRWRGRPHGHAVRDGGARRAPHQSRQQVHCPSVIDDMAGVACSHRPASSQQIKCLE